MRPKTAKRQPIPKPQFLQDDSDDEERKKQDKEERLAALKSHE